MGLLDPLFDALANGIEKFDDIAEAITNPDIDGDQASDLIAGLLEDVTVQDEVFATFVDSAEEFIISDLEEEGPITPENVEETADQLEGAAASILFNLATAGSTLEAASLGQIDKQSEYITQAVTALGVEDVTGLELDARLQEGILPAMEAKAGKEHRSKFVDIQDAVEYLLRQKDGDAGWLQGENIPREAYEQIRSNDPENPSNAVEEWGIRDDQLDILEFVALEAMEFEELIETPAELGLIVDDEVLDLVLDLAGYPEPLKDFLRKVPDEIPNSNRIWQERTAVEPLVQALETLASDGEISPREARELIPDDVEQAKPALEERFRNLQSVPPGSPTRAQVEGSFARGYTDLDTLQERLNRLEFDVEEYDGVVRSAVLDELDGSLQESVALGLISEDTYSNLAGFVGLDQRATDALLAGQSLSDITKRRLKEETDPGDRPPTAIQGIGEARATSLSTIGIESLSDLAAADTDDVAEATQVSPETAETWIGQAGQATS